MSATVQLFRSDHPESNHFATFRWLYKCYYMIWHLLGGLTYTLFLGYSGTLLHNHETGQVSGGFHLDYCMREYNQTVQSAPYTKHQ